MTLSMSNRTLVALSLLAAAVGCAEKSGDTAEVPGATAPNPLPPVTKLSEKNSDATEGTRNSTVKTMAAGR